MDNTKACPYCGEEILAVAIKCKHCGSTLECGGIAAGQATAGAVAMKTADLKVPLLVLTERGTGR